jgi:hypothetical protein
MKTFTTALVTTHSRDRYVYTFDYLPTVEEVVKMVYEREGGEEAGVSLDWYMDTTDVEFDESPIFTKPKKKGK